MTRQYPLLTVQSVKYRYWECYPHWSQIDIAKEVGCSPSLVSYFMIKHDIPRRTPTEAGLNAYDCPHKLEKFTNGAKIVFLVNLEAR